MRVAVYRNLHKNTFSIKSHAANCIVGHGDSVVLDNARFRVSRAGRKRVLETKVKNVHAMVHGILRFWNGEVYKGRETEIPPVQDHFDLPHPSTVEQVIYNPYKFDSFVYREGHQAVLIAKHVWLHNGMVLVPKRGTKLSYSFARS